MGLIVTIATHAVIETVIHNLSIYIRMHRIIYVSPSDVTLIDRETEIKVKLFRLHVPTKIVKVVSL